MTVAYSEQTIAGCETRLRLYDGRLTGPTLEASPGDTLNVDIFNRLPEDPSPHPENINIPYGFNRTNLHTHGLHVSPVGNADNVLLEIQPGKTFQNEIKIPRDHPPGTFWYHPHVHGATAVQVGSGMAGALVIRGGIDHLPQIEKMQEHILIFQQIPYDENGLVEDFKKSFGPRAWGRSKRRTTINGQIFPVIHMRPGEIQRWRMIHAGVRETLALDLEGHVLNEIAVDGLVTGRIDAWSRLELQPGYRSDVLVQAAPLPSGQRSAEYILYDSPSPKERSLLGENETSKPLAKILVEGLPVSMQMPREAALQRFIPFSPIEKIYLFDLYSIWKGHGGHDRPAVDIVIDLTDELAALSVDHVGEIWKLAVAVSQEEETEGGDLSSGVFPINNLAVGEARIEGINKH